MASVLFSNIEDGMCSLIIDGEEFIEEEGRAVIPKAVLKQLQIEDIPDDLEIEVCELCHWYMWGLLIMYEQASKEALKVVGIYYRSCRNH